MRILDEETEKIVRLFLALNKNDWIEWVAQKNNFEDDCDKFDGCYFVVGEMPKYPQHPMCRCKLVKIKKPVPGVTAKANCDIRKFSGYIFNSKYEDGKKELFESWGYNIEDSLYLQQLYTQQAEQAYCDGKYQYLESGGQIVKICIYIVLKNQNGKKQEIKTIWELGKKGHIRLITPYSGHHYEGE